MRGFVLKLGVLIGAIMLAGGALAGTLTVKSPVEGAYLGLSNSVKFLITGATLEVEVSLKVEGPTGLIELSDTFDPNSEGRIDSQIALNFSESTPQGDYTITVTAEEPGNTYPPQVVNVKVDTIRPKFVSYTPRTGSFVKDLVRIRAELREDNLDKWEVKVNNTAIPGNTGFTNNVAVNWDASSIETDGAQAISIVATDLAGNTATQTVTVTLDRIAPVVTIAYPLGSTPVPSRMIIPVLIDIVDAGATSVDLTGVDVIATMEDGTYLTRISRISFAPTNATTLRWTGRMAPHFTFPRRFKIVVTAVDRAGNRAARQEVLVRIK